MSDFIRVGMRSEEIPSFLTASVTGFRESSEYRELREYERDIPSVVCSAFARYVCHITREQVTGEGRARVGTALASAHAAIDAMAASPATAIQSLITDEVFENLECEPAVFDTIRNSLKPNAAALYTHWRAKIL